MHVVLSMGTNEVCASLRDGLYFYLLVVKSTKCFWTNSLLWSLLLECPWSTLVDSHMLFFQLHGNCSSLETALLLSWQWLSERGELILICCFLLLHSSYIPVEGTAIAFLLPHPSSWMLEKHSCIICLHTSSNSQSALGRISSLANIIQQANEETKWGTPFFTAASLPLLFG